MKLKQHAEYAVSQVVAETLAHIVIKTVVDPLINTFLPKPKKTESPE